MQVTAQLNYLRIAPRKLRLVAGPLRGLMVENAEAQLTAIFKRGANPLGKLLKSAVQNAEHNFQLPKSNLFIKDIVVNEGVKLKRYMPRAQGVAHPIQKKTTHIEIILAEKVAGLKLKNVERPAPDIALASGNAGTAADEAAGTQSRRSNIGTGTLGTGTVKPSALGRVKNASRRFFRRKSI
ncbi:MAG: 50S ribosomal protein L22 [Parcubacteria group bacterium GW2011_GWB1_48_6]|nr:MAG: 50S ribosomal protein L22 [Parcubacteria group bacterium GW2011_GWB1_48_6]HXK35678.1 50S ribosomal protein L22 [Candidatus Paceibacterota bacterium]